MPASAPLTLPHAVQYLDPAVITLLQDPMSNLTVFAPPEADLLALLGGVQSEQVPPDTARTILLAHVVTDFLQAEDLLMMDEAMLPTAAGAGVILDVSIQGSAITLTANNSVQVRAPSRHAARRIVWPS